MIRVGSLLLATVAICGACAPAEPPEGRCLIDYDIDKAAEMADIDRGDVVVRRLQSGAATESTLFQDEIARLKRRSEILADRTRPVDAFDVSILDGALARMDDDSRWDRADDRECSDDDTTYSLYCALYFSSIDYLGHYEHGRTAIQEVRFAIEDLSSGQEFEHRLMDFNNAADKTLEDIKGVVRLARDRVTGRLARQEDCSIEY